MIKSNYITEYNNKVQSGEIVACRKIKTVYKALVRDITDKNSRWIFSEKRATHAIEFIERFCKHSKGKFARKNVVLELWQKALISAIFGILDKNTNLRRFREVLFIVGKKNGKSLLASAISLYMLVADGEGGAECYCVATKREQAKIVFTEAENMVAQSPSLRKRIAIRTNKLIFDLTKSCFKPLSSDSNTEDGLNIHFAEMDEIHAWKTLDLYNIVADGISAREEPLLLLTSTAGTIREGLYDKKYNDAEQIINGYFDEKGIKNDTILPVIYELDSRSEYTDPNCWIKANPNMGVSKKIEYLEQKVLQAKLNPMDLKNVLTKEFNIRETSTEVWLNFDDIYNTSKFDISTMPVRYCIGGADLSRTTDLTSACILFKVKNDTTIYVETMYWLPAELLEKRTIEDRIPYDKWHEQGYLRTSVGNKVDYDDVVAWFVEISTKYNITLYDHRYDAWSAQSYVKNMGETFGNINHAVIQGKKTLSNPMRLLGADLTSKLVNYNDNPITRWCLTNVRADVDRNDNIQPAKTSNSKRRIDGFASMLNAYVGFIENRTEYENLI